MIRVAHVITGLGVGGAEMMLVKLLEGIDRSEFTNTVITLSSDHALASRVTAGGTPVIGLDVPKSVTGGLGALPRAIRALRSFQPDVIQTWLYHADLLGGIAGRVVGVPVLWNVQTSTIEPGGRGARTRRVARVCGAISKIVPLRIVSCSRAAIEAHAPFHYAVDRFVVIPNGTDLTAFRPDPEARASVRAELGLRDDEKVLGMFARRHPQKDHETLIEAMRLLLHDAPASRLVLCGLGLEPENESMTELFVRAGIESRVIRLGVRMDVARIMNALDLHVLSSAFGEGFPNVLGEAMACGVPCVATDVGDSRMIVGEAGRVVPPKDPSALAAAATELLTLSPDDFQALREKARARVVREFALAGSITRYENLYRRVVEGS
jgi:glycosyltransferase involved in cell wall biosynthesis